MKRLLLVAAAIVIAGARPAWAHEEIIPATIPTGKPVFLTLRTANEKKVGLSKVVLIPPNGVTFGTTTKEPPGWDVVRTDTSITWSGGLVKPDHFEDWGYEIEGADQPETLTYSVELSYADGSSDKVTVTVTVTAGAGAATTPSEGSTVSTAAPSAPSAPTAGPAAASTARGRANAALVVAIVAAALALAALVAILLGRRPRGEAQAEVVGPKPEEPGPTAAEPTPIETTAIEAGAGPPRTGPPASEPEGTATAAPGEGGTEPPTAEPDEAHTAGTVPKEAGAKGAETKRAQPKGTGPNGSTPAPTDPEEADDAQDW